MKKLISIVSAIAMMASMAFTVHAEAPTISLKYDEANSTEEKLVIDVYYTGTIDAADLLFYLVDGNGDEAGTKYIADDEGAVSIYQNNSGLASANLAGMYNSDLGLIAVNFMDTFTQPADKPAIKIGIDLKKAIDVNLSYELDVDNYVSANDEDYYEEVVLGDCLAITVGSTGDDEPALEEAEEVKAFTEEGSAPATAFKVTTNAVEGKSAYWTATIGGTPMITKNAIPNVSGEVTLGLVFHGTQTISNVNLLWK